jgi:hypothetical protein
VREQAEGGLMASEQSAGLANHRRLTARENVSSREHSHVAVDSSSTNWTLSHMTFRNSFDELRCTCRAKAEVLAWQEKGILCIFETNNAMTFTVFIFFSSNLSEIEVTFKGSKTKRKKVKTSIAPFRYSPSQETNSNRFRV